MEASWNLRGTLNGVKWEITTMFSSVYNFSMEGGTYFCKKLLQRAALLSMEPKGDVFTINGLIYSLSISSRLIPVILLISLIS